MTRPGEPGQPPGGVGVPAGGGQGGEAAPDPLLGHTDVLAVAVTDARRRRWVLRHRARSLQAKGPGSCGKHALTGQLSLARRGERWAVSGVMHCGRIWVCPVCAARVGQRRAEEIAEAIRRWHAEGGTVLLVTYTLAHDADDQLDALLGVFTAARRRLRGRKEWRDLRREIGWEGDVGNWEVTHGDWHGWHPHRHHLVFCRPPARWSQAWELVRWWRRLEALWVDCVAGVSERHRPGDGDRLGVAVRVDVVGRGAGETAAGYLLKDLQHGAAMEVARPEAKTGRQGRRTPWELLEGAVDGWQRERELWGRYAAATKGRHRVQWSRGLRERLGVQVRTDEELANDDGDADETEDLDDDETALLVWADEVTPHVLEAAERDGPAGAHAFLAMLLATLTALERAELRAWARGRVDLAGRWSRPRRRDGPGVDVRRSLRWWASGNGSQYPAPA